MIDAKEQLISAAKQGGSGGTMSAEQEEALKKLKEELDRQEESLKEQRQALKDREEFLEQSEAALFSKMQEQQEKETELEQREVEIRRAMEKAGLAAPAAPEPKEKA